MAILAPDSAGTLFLEYGGWFGSPALLRVQPSQISSANVSRDLVLDGWSRFIALQGSSSPLLKPLWQSGKFPHLVFPHAHHEGLYSTEGHKLLPRMLVLAGHHDRAWQFIPDIWTSSARDVADFLNVAMVDAVCVWTCRKRLRKAHPTIRHFNHSSRMVAQIRAGFAELDELGKGFSLEDVRRIVA